MEQIGQGGYGTIWIVDDAVTGKRLALKEISKATTNKSEFKWELWISTTKNIQTSSTLTMLTRQTLIILQFKIMHLEETCLMLLSEMQD